MAGRPPLRHVAELAGVSEPTVSRVLNGRTGVAEETRAKVVAVLNELGHADVPVPTRSPRRVVGMICGEFSNPVFPAMVHAITTELGRKGHLTISSVADPVLNPEERCIAELQHAEVDAIVFVGGRHSEVDADYEHYHRVASTATRLVFVNGGLTDVDAPHVRCDERSGAIKAVEHLVRLGHDRIGCILGSPNFVPTPRFIDGYRTVLARHGMAEPADAIVEVPFTLEGGRAGAARLLQQGVTAAIAGNDLMALGALRAARTVGQPFSVVGYDGTDLTEISDPPLTTLRQPLDDMAELVADSVIAEINGSDKYRDDFVFEPQLVVRDSTRANAAAT